MVQNIDDTENSSKVNEIKDYQAWLLCAILGLLSCIPCYFLLPHATGPIIVNFNFWLGLMIFLLFFFPLVISFINPHQVWRWAISVTAGFNVAVCFWSINEKYLSDILFYSMLISIPFTFIGAYAGLWLNQFSNKAGKHNHFGDME